MLRRFSAAPAPLPARRRHILVFAALVVAHVGLIAVVLRQRTPVQEPAGQSMQVAAVAPPVDTVPVVIPTVTDTVIASDVSAPDFAVEASGGSSCALDAEIARAIADDAAALRALIDIPVAARSVANAAMVWDGRWADAESAPPALRQRIAATVRAASADCRDAEVIGPRLIFVASAGGIALAVGSGRWRWSALNGEE